MARRRPCDQRWVSTGRCAPATSDGYATDASSASTRNTSTVRGDVTTNDPSALRDNTGATPPAEMAPDNVTDSNEPSPKG